MAEGAVGCTTETGTFVEIRETVSCEFICFL